MVPTSEALFFSPSPYVPFFLPMHMCVCVKYQPKSMVLLIQNFNLL